MALILLGFTIIITLIIISCEILRFRKRTDQENEKFEQCLIAQGWTQDQITAFCKR